MSKNFPPDSMKSMPVRLPIEAVKDLMWIQENIKGQVMTIPWGRLAATAIKKYRKDMERNA